MSNILPVIYYRVGVQTHRSNLVVEALEVLGLTMVDGTVTSYIHNDLTFNWVDLVFAYYPTHIGDLYTEVYSTVADIVTNTTGALSNSQQLAIIESIDTNTPMLLGLDTTIRIKNFIGRVGEYEDFPAFDIDFEQLPAASGVVSGIPYISVFEYGINRKIWDNEVFKGRTSAVLYLAPYEQGLTKGYVFAADADRLLALLGTNGLSADTLLLPDAVNALFRLYQYNIERYTECVGVIYAHIEKYGLMSADLLTSIILEYSVM